MSVARESSLNFEAGTLRLRGNNRHGPFEVVIDGRRAKLNWNDFLSSLPRQLELDRHVFPLGGVTR